MMIIDKNMEKKINDLKVICNEISYGGRDANPSEFPFILECSRLFDELKKKFDTEEKISSRDRQLMGELSSEILLIYRNLMKQVRRKRKLDDNGGGVPSR